MDALILVARDNTRHTRSAEFGVDVPRVGETLVVDDTIYHVISVRRVMSPRVDASPVLAQWAVLVQWERHVTATELDPRLTSAPSASDGGPVGS